MTAVPAYASTWNNGDVFAGVSSGNYQVYDNSGVFKETVNAGSGFTTGCALDSAGNLFGTYFSNSLVQKFDATTHVPSSFGSGFATPESVAFDATGNVFVGNLGAGIREFDSAGNFIKTVIGGRVDWFDIAADQDTIFYTDEGTSIHRVSISSGPLSDFTTGTASHAFALRILSDGSVLLADNVNIKHYNSTGTLITQTYTTGGEGTWFSLNLDPNGTSFWAGNYGTANFYRFNILSGLVEVGPINTGTGSNSLFGLCLKGELTAAKQSITLSPATATNEAGSNHTVTANVTKGGKPDAGVTVTFTVTSGPDTGTSGAAITDASGNASFTYTNTGGVGTDTIEACFVDSSGNRQCAKATKDWISTKTITTYTGQTTQDFNDPATLSANLRDSSNKPVSGATINFNLDGQSCTGTTDASGNASCTITPNEPAGSYTVTASFAGDKSHKPSSDSKTFTVTLEETTTTYTGPTIIAQGQPVSAVLKEDGSTAISGRTVTLSLTTGENCSGITDGSGNVSCTLSGYPLGPNTITASFAGDAFYQPSSDTQPVLIFANLSSGSFVLGDQTVNSASPTTDLTWWGAKWWKLNDLSGGSAPAAFKGFADTTSSPPSCGKTWTTDPGNSSKPPASVPSYMSVIVADSISKSGNMITGDTPKIVIVKTDPGYANNPGHAGTGTVVATLCGK